MARRERLFIRLVFFTILFLNLVVAQSPRAQLQAWIEQNRLIVNETRTSKDVEVRLFSLKRTDYGNLAKECVSMYKKTYQVRMGVWCYVYDNGQALDTDLRPISAPGRTPGTCWIYRASQAFSGKLSFEKNDALVLRVGKCPRP